MTARKIGMLLLAASILPGLALANENLAPTSDETVFMRGWAYKPNIVQENVDKYNAELGGNVDYATITGDYPSIIENRLIAGEPIDFFYSNPFIAYRMNGGGYAMTVDEALPDMIDEIKAEMYPNILEAWSNSDGELLGLSYFVSDRGVIHVNMKMLRDAGIPEEDWPTTWDELYDLMHVLKNEHGIETPFLPHWFNEYYGIGWGFTFEVLNRGGQFADPETHQPVLSTTEGAAYETLKDWKEAINSGLVPESVLSMRESDYVEAWTSGKYAMSPQQIYDLAPFNDPERSAIAGEVTLLPYKGQSWGFVDSGIYVLSSRDRSPDSQEDTARFFNWYGYKDQNGEFFIADKWVDESILFSGYKSVMENPRTAEVITSKLARPEDYQTMLDVYAEMPYPNGIWKVIWSSEFDPFLKDLVTDFLANDREIEPTIQAINDHITELNDEYGI